MKAPIESKSAAGGAFLRRHNFRAERLTSPITTDAFGTEFRFYVRSGGAVHVSSSVRALARLLGRATLNPRALAEALAFGFVLRDETVFNEVRSIPPHTTLNLDGTLTPHAGPEKRDRIRDADAAVREFRGTLDGIVRDLEPRWEVHCAGLTGGKDSRILAALPKAAPDRWHWLSVSGRDDAEHRGATATAEHLHLTHFSWLEWTSAFLDGDAHRVSADLANGVGAVSDHTLLRSYFEGYRRSVLHRDDHAGDVALWIGTLADGLLAGTYFNPPANTIWEAIGPRTAHLPTVLSPEALDAFNAQRPYYDSNPFSFTPATAEDIGWFIRLFTRGRCYVCRSLGCFDRFSQAQVNPYLHPAMIGLALDTEGSLLTADRLRDGVLEGLGPDLTGPSAFGYRAPAYAHHVFRALKDEVSRNHIVDEVIAAPLLDAMRAGRFTELTPTPADAGPAAPAYRVHAEGAQPVIRSLRDYEHLLVYVAFLNLVADDGVVMTP